VSNKHLSRMPHHVREDVWWYDERGGICIISAWRDGDRYIRTDSFLIPWRDLRRAIERKDRK